MNKIVISLLRLLNGGLYKDDITRNTSESTKIDTRLKVSGILKNVSDCKYILYISLMFNDANRENIGTLGGPNMDKKISKNDMTRKNNLLLNRLKKILYCN